MSICKRFLDYLLPISDRAKPKRQYHLCLPTHFSSPLSIFSATHCSPNWHEQEGSTMKPYLLTMAFCKSSRTRIRWMRQERKLNQSIILLTLALPSFHPRFLVWPWAQKRRGYMCLGFLFRPFKLPHSSLSPSY